MAVSETKAALPAAGVQIVEFDFNTRRERAITPSEARHAGERGRFCWIDIDVDQAGEVRPFLDELQVNPDAAREALQTATGGRHEFYPDCLHLTMTSGLWVREEFDPRHVQLLMGERWLITLHRGPEEFLEQVRRHYSDDFTRFARTPSFLLYECWDYLIATYKRLSKELEDRLEKVQAEIFRQVDDEIFASVAELTRDVMALRKTLLLSREVLNDVATRRSSFVAESSQPFLDRLVGTLDRMAGDLTTQREMLAETLSLYMGMVSHRTNKVVNRLTVVSVIFLPLSVLVAIYGSNFQIPEVHWKYGYLYLWTLILVIAGGLLTWMRRQRWW